jgi:hypothetical protein
VVENNGGLRTGSCGEEGNAHSPPDIHYGKEPNKGKRLMRRSAPSQEPAGKTEADAAGAYPQGDYPADRQLTDLLRGLMILVAARRRPRLWKLNIQNIREAIMSTDEKMKEMEGQLARIRWFNRCLIACIVLSLWVWFISKTFGPEMVWAQSGEKEIRGKRFILEDENGKNRVTLSVTNLGSGLTWPDENGKKRVVLGMVKGVPALMLYDENGEYRAGLLVHKDKPSLTLYDENGEYRAVLQVEKNGPTLGLFDENSKVIWHAP